MARLVLLARVYLSRFRGVRPGSYRRAVATGGSTGGGT